MYFKKGTVFKRNGKILWVKSGGLLTDFIKAFDCLDHELLTAKLYANSFSFLVFRLIHGYLSN